MTECHATLYFQGETFECTVEAPHPSVAHGNDEADASWCSDGEARACERKQARS